MRLVIAVIGVIACALPVSWCQELPPPKPKPPTDQATPAASIKTTRVTSGPAILLMADENCKIKLDGEELGKLKKGESKKFSVGLGEHLIEAITLEGKFQWQQTLTLEKNIQVIVKIALTPQVEAAAEEKRLQHAEAEAQRQAALEESKRQEQDARAKRSEAERAEQKRRDLLTVPGLPGVAVCLKNETSVALYEDNATGDELGKVSCGESIVILEKRNFSYLVRSRKGIVGRVRFDRISESVNSK